MEKIKTIGDAYMCAGGLPEISPSHSLDTIRSGLEILSYVKMRLKDPKVKKTDKWNVRIGIHSGSVVAGIVGDIKYVYDIWGDTVNLASRMESGGEVGKVNVSKRIYEDLKEYPDFKFIPRGNVKAKNKGEIEMYFVESTNEI